MRYAFFLIAYFIVLFTPFNSYATSLKTRVIVTSDGEVDDQCSIVRFLLYANEWDIEGIVTSSSQYHWQGHNWAGDDWLAPYLDAYSEVYPNLLKHDPTYPSPEFLVKRTFLGNVLTEGDMTEETPGSKHIAKVLLDSSDSRPIWVQAWGGTNTIARALKSIEEKHPERMAEVASKLRFFFIWEQDSSYRDYIKPRWGKFQIPTIISDQFWALAYQWKLIQPKNLHSYFSSSWTKENILQDHGPLCALYPAHTSNSHGLSHDRNFLAGEFRSEGDSPAFLHTIPNGLRSLESPDWGGWGGRYIQVYDNTWLDPVPNENYRYPKGRWYTQNAWGRVSLRQGETSVNNPRVKAYFKPLWRWTSAIQNDFAARADWTVKNYEDANHPPIVKVNQALNIQVSPGEKIPLNAEGTYDPDDDSLSYFWWQYEEADSYTGSVNIRKPNKKQTFLKIPKDAKAGQTIHIVLEVSDNGSPKLTRYQRIVLRIQ